MKDGILDVPLRVADGIAKGTAGLIQLVHHFVGVVDAFVAHVSFWSWMGRDMPGYPPGLSLKPTLCSAQRLWMGSVVVLAGRRPHHIGDDTDVGFDLSRAIAQILGFLPQTFDGFQALSSLDVLSLGLPMRSLDLAQSQLRLVHVFLHLRLVMDGKAMRRIMGFH